MTDGRKEESQRQRGHTLGLHRVIEPPGALPQAADRLDASGPMYTNEVCLQVETLNIASASFSQIVGEVGANEEAVAAQIEQIVAGRGKMQNPVTGSGGMLLGRVAEVGAEYDGPVELTAGDRVATLVSLTLTPLRIERVKAVRLDADQVDVEATAYLWPSAPLVVLGRQDNERVALAALDVCGAPAQTRRLVEDARSVVVMGTGKSGMLAAAAARDTRGDDVHIVGIDIDEKGLVELADAGLFDAVAVADATPPVEVLEAVEQCLRGGRADVVINTCNIAGAEMSAILAVCQRGTVYFFNMATDFSRAALGAEGVGCDAQLLIGNGYAQGHAEYALELVERYPVVRRRIEKLVGSAES